MMGPLVLLAAIVVAASASRFEDVSVAAGMRRKHGPRLKYGGAAVADLDGDGFPDLLFQHHNDRWADVYFNQRNGSFHRADWTVWRDTHSLNPFRLTPRERGMHFILSMGGGNGNRPRSPIIFRVHRNRTIEPRPQPDLIKHAMARGRSAVFLKLREGKRTVDAVITSARATSNTHGVHHFFQGSRKGFAFKNITTGFAMDLNKFATLTDVDGDGVMEVLSYHELRMHRRVADFDLRDVTSVVFPPGLALSGTVSVAELDFDNDGLWDLYVARTNTGNNAWLRGNMRNPHQRDYLFRNVGGQYEDVSASAGLTRESLQTRGVTTGDFDNDGFVDLLLSRFETPDVLLMNNGDGTFREEDAGLGRASDVHGDHATAVDYDRDGRVDAIVSEGDWGNHNYGGFFRIMRNVGVVQKYLLVRVKSSRSRSATSLHAVVTVTTPGLSMMRRVGSPGTAVSNSYIELLHFGVGSASTVSVSVRWSSGEVKTIQKVRTGRIVVFGR